MWLQPKRPSTNACIKKVCVHTVECHAAFISYLFIKKIFYIIHNLFPNIKHTWQCAIININIELIINPISLISIKVFIEYKIIHRN